MDNGTLVVGGLVLVIAAGVAYEILTPDSALNQLIAQLQQGTTGPSAGSSGPGTTLSVTNVPPVYTSQPPLLYDPQAQTGELPSTTTNNYYYTTPSTSSSGSTYVAPAPVVNTVPALTASQQFGNSPQGSTSSPNASNVITQTYPGISLPVETVNQAVSSAIPSAVINSPVTTTSTTSPKPTTMTTTTSIPTTTTTTTINQTPASSVGLTNPISTITTDISGGLKAVATTVSNEYNAATSVLNSAEKELGSIFGGIHI